MTQMTALILAAGLGVRMGPRGELMPKGMLNVGDGRLVPQSVDSLRRWGADRIIVVTGHLADQYEAEFAGTNVELIHNPDYATTGSLLTLATGLAAIDGPCLVLESDLIYAPQVLERIPRNKDCFTVSGPTGAGDEVYTWVDSNRDTNRLVEISKSIAQRREPPLGEMIGVSGLSTNSAIKMRDVAKSVLDLNPAAHYEQGLVALAQLVDIECLFFEDVAWAEIDDELMLQRAQDSVVPRVQAARQALWGD